MLLSYIYTLQFFNDKFVIKTTKRRRGIRIYLFENLLFLFICFDFDFIFPFSVFQKKCKKHVRNFFTNRPKSNSSKSNSSTNRMALKRSTSAHSIFITVEYVTSSQLSLRTYCGRLMMDRSSQVSQTKLILKS